VEAGATVASARRGKNLVIVESPAKAKTIQKYLGPGFEVLASYGHVRDLPRRKRAGEDIAGVKISEGWKPTYVVEDREDKKGGKASFKRRSTREILAELKRQAAKASQIFLATDPDREGEAIAWHLSDELKLDESRTFRITFNEITRAAVQSALSHAGKIDMKRVRAQEARRILDRVVGYPLSGLLGRKVTRGLSAGRVQSVAVRLIVEREREIEAFKPEEFWKLTAILAPKGLLTFESKPYIVKLSPERASESSPGQRPGEEDGAPAKPEKETKPALPEGAFPAELVEWNGAKFAAKTETDARAIAELLDVATYSVRKIEQKDQKQKPQPPFTTSTLQQQASLRLHFSASRTMQAAQKLYEGVDLGGEGPVALITYMRTDSTRVSADALSAVRQHIETTYGPPYLPAQPNHYASGKSAQEAHEAIRPTDLSYTPQRVAKELSPSVPHRHDLIRLYELIYRRFVASQMTPAVFAVTNVEVVASGQWPVASAEKSPSSLATSHQPLATAEGVLKAQGRILKFDGYRRVLTPGHKNEDTLLPPLTEKQALDKLELTASQHFTEPPPRFNEASLVKTLEKEGIGRPSTYASIISTIQLRGYVEQKDRRFYAKEIGKVVNDLLVEHFPNVLDVKFTSHMEEELDEIENGKLLYGQVLNEFWGPFSQALEVAESKMPAKKGEETGENCPRCGKPLVIQYSKKTGNKFIGCSGWREGCRYIKPREGEEARPEPVETDYKCPTCNSPMIQRIGQRGPFLGCSKYPECRTTMNFDAQGKPVLSSRPTEHVCDKCGAPMVIREGPRGPFLACTAFPKCRNAKDVDAQGNPIKPIETGEKCAKCESPMVVKRGPRGPFLGCSAYPKCRSTKPVPEELKEKLKTLMPAPAKKAVPKVEVSEKCPECGSAMELRRGRRGYFLGCSMFSKTKCRGAREVPPEVLEQIQETS
jgi:DNA topoisomerase-1